MCADMCRHVYTSVYTVALYLLALFAVDRQRACLGDQRLELVPPNLASQCLRGLGGPVLGFANQQLDRRYSSELDDRRCARCLQLLECF